MEIISSNLNLTILGFFLFLLSSVFTFKKLTRAHTYRVPPEAAGGWPIIGHLHLLLGPKLPHETLGAMADKYGPIFTIRVGIHKALIINNWEMAKECYTSLDSIVSSRPKTLFGKILGYNFAGFGFRPYYDLFYRSMRKIIASELLSNRRLLEQREIRVNEVNRAMKDVYELWVKKTEDLELDMEEWIGNVDLNVILRMVCGKRLVGDDEMMKRCRKAMREFFDLAGQFMVADAIPFLRWLDLGGYEKAMKKTSKELDYFIGEWLEEHRRKGDSAAAAADGRGDFMDVMLSILEEEGVELGGYDAHTVNKATCMALITGGTDTLTVTLIWAISFLLNNREVLRKAQEELDNYVGNKRLVDESDINKLVYLQAIVKETMRLYPAGPLSGIREFSQDCTLGGYHVTAGTRLIPNLWKIQTDPRVWEEPLEFKPERFLSSRQRHVDVKGHNYELGPFGFGRRACPGLEFGVQMTQLVLASLVHSFEIGTRFGEPVDMVANVGLTMHRVNPLRVILKPRLLPSAYA